MTVEELQVLITANTDSLRNEIKSTQTQLTTLQRTAGKASNGIFNAFSALKTAIVGLAIGKLISANLDDAVSRLDTLNNFPRVMSNLGISNDDAQASINRLQDALTGLPTALDSASQSVQRLTSANGNVKASTEMFLAMNNAILAGGAPMEQQKSAMEQLSQAYAKGKPDMMEWRSMLSVMPAQLNQLAIAMGYASSNQLGEALRDGTVSMNDFMLKMIELNQHGVNGFLSFEEQARNSTGGIATSIANVRTAFTRGLADIMNAIGQSNIAGFFQGVARAINNVIPYIVAFIKLIGTAVNFVAGLFGKKLGSATKTTQSLGTSLGGVGSAANNASAGLNKAGNSGGKTAKGLNKATNSAKKLNKELKGLASFDEMNVLAEKKTDADTPKNPSGGGSPVGGAGGLGDIGGIGDLGSIDLSGFDALSKGASKADEIYKNMINSLKKLADYISSFDFSGIINHAKSIGQTLRDIFTDPKVVAAAQKWATNVKDTLKTVVKSAITIGTNITEGLIGSVDKYLLQNKDRIKKFIIDMFDISNTHLSYVSKFSKALAEISSIFKSNDAKQIGADIISIFVNSLMSVTKLFGKFANDVEGLFVMPIVNNVDKIKQTMENVLKPLRKMFDTIADIFTYLGDSLNNVYDAHIHPLIQSITSGISDTFGKFLDVYNEYIVPFIDKTVERFQVLWENHLKPLWDNLMDLIGSVADLLKTFWEQSLKPLIDWIIQNIIPAIVPILDTAKATVFTAISIIADVISGLIQVISGVIKFVTGVFNGDWKKAWEGIKQAFSAPINAVQSIFITVMDYIKTRFNNAIDFTTNVLNIIVNTVKSIFSKIIDIARDVWSGVKSVFNVVGSWFTSTWNNMLNAVKPIFEKLKTIAQNIWNGIKSVFSTVTSWFTTTWNNMVSNVTSIFNKIKTLASNIWTSVKNTFSSVNTWFRDKFNSAYTAIKNVFNPIVNFFGGLWDKIKSKFTSLGTKIGDAVGGAFKSAINGALRTIENVMNAPINAINSLLSVINKVPGVNLSRLSHLSLPRLAKGGIVSRPTLAQIGESGKEAVIPLENNTGWIDKLADKLSENLSSSNTPLQLIVKIGEDKIADKVIDSINRKVFETGREVFSL